jgi:hypothetical protein
VLRAGHFILFQTDGWERFTILAFANVIDDIESTTPLVEYVAPARDRISFGYDWFAPGRGGEPVFCPVASPREVHAQRERVLLRLHDAAFAAAVAQLAAALAGNPDRDRLKAVGVEALAMKADRRKVAKHAHVDHRQVGDYFWRLGEVDPGLFPAFIDARTRELEELFADVLDQWQAEVVRMRARWTDFDHYRIAREIRASRLRDLRAQMPSFDEMARRARIGKAAKVAKLVEDVRPGETLRSMQLEFAGRDDGRPLAGAVCGARAPVWAVIRRCLRTCRGFPARGPGVGGGDRADDRDSAWHQMVSRHRSAVLQEVQSMFPA